MKRATLLLTPLFCAVLAVPAHSADVVWTNAAFDNLFLNPANWSPAPETPLDQDGSGFLSPLELADNFTLDNFDVVTLGAGASLAAGDISITIGTFTTLDATVSGISGDGDATTQESIFLTGPFASLNSQFVSAGITVEIAADAEVTLRGGDQPINASTVNFQSETSGQINATNKTVEDANFFTTFLPNITVAGHGAVLGANVDVVSDGATGVTVTPREATVFADVDRTTGAVTLVNEGAAIAFDSYTLTSAAGGLDVAGYTPITNDGSDAWTVNEQLATSIVESEDPMNDGTAVDAGVSFGTVWRTSPVEDLALELNLAGGGTQGVVIRYSGPEAVQGDLNLDGAVDLGDWDVFRSNLLSEYDPETTSQVDAYFLGDFNGDFDTDVFDLDVFEQFFDAANGAGSFSRALAGVPEPTAAALASLVVALTLVRRRAALLVLAAVCGLAATNEARADITWTGAGIAGDLFDDANYDFSQSTLTAIDESVPIEDNVLFQSDSVIGGGFTVQFGNVFIADTFTMTFDNFAVDSSGSTGGFSGDANSIIELNNNTDLNLQFLAGGSYRIDGTSSLLLRGGGDPINGQTRPIEVLLEQDAQLTLASLAEFTEQGNQIFAANTDGFLVPFSDDTSILDISGTVATAVNENLFGRPAPLTVEVDRATGEVTLVNPNTGPIDFTFDFYSIAGSLNAGAWTSLEAQNLPGFESDTGAGDGWAEAGGSDDTELGEVILNGSSTLVGGADAISLGAIYDVFSGAEDVQFTYRNANSDAVVAGAVTYVGVAPEVLTGDFNADGVVDAADYTVWRDNFGSDDLSLINNAGDGSATIDQGDYDVWEANFGATSAAAAAVPEPTALLAASLALVGASLPARGRRTA